MISLILPNYSQSDQISVLAGTRVGQDYSWKLASYQAAVSSLGMPLSWTRGIPAPIAAREPASGFILIQLVLTRSGNKIWTFAIRSGKDLTGRDVFLTLITDEDFFEADISESIHRALVELEKGHTDGAVHYVLPSDEIRNFDESLHAILDCHRADSQRNWYRGEERDLGKEHYANVSFEGMSYVPDSQEDVGAWSSVRHRYESLTPGQKRAILAVTSAAAAVGIGMGAAWTVSRINEPHRKEITHETGDRADLPPSDAPRDGGTPEAPSSQ